MWDPTRTSLTRGTSGQILMSPQHCPTAADRDWYPPLIDRLREVEQLTQSHSVPDMRWFSALCCRLHGARGALEEVELAAAGPSPSSPHASALLAAIEAMKKAYQEELSRELSKTRSLQQGPDGLRKQHQ